MLTSLQHNRSPFAQSEKHSVHAAQPRRKATLLVVIFMVQKASETLTIIYTPLFPWAVLCTDNTQCL